MFTCKYLFFYEKDICRNIQLNVTVPISFIFSFYINNNKKILFETLSGFLFSVNNYLLIGFFIIKREAGQK